MIASSLFLFTALVISLYVLFLFSCIFKNLTSLNGFSMTQSFFSNILMSINNLFLPHNNNNNNCNNVGKLHNNEIMWYHLIIVVMRENKILDKSYDYRLYIIRIFSHRKIITITVVGGRRTGHLRYPSKQSKDEGCYIIHLRSRGFMYCASRQFCAVKCFTILPFFNK